MSDEQKTPEGPKDDPSIVTEANETFTRFQIGNESYTMREMTIGRTRDFAILFSEAIDDIKTIAGVDNIAEVDLDSAIAQYAETLAASVAKMWNFVFEFRNDKYSPIDAKWVLDNLTPGMVVTVVKELARLSRLDWLGPFLKSQLLKTAAGMTTRKTSPVIN